MLFKSYDGDKIWFHTYIHTYIHTCINFFKPIILTQKPQKHRNSSKSLIKKFSPLQSFLFEKAKIDPEYFTVSLLTRDNFIDFISYFLQYLHIL